MQPEALREGLDELRCTARANAISTSGMHVPDQRSRRATDTVTGRSQDDGSFIPGGANLNLGPGPMGEIR